MSANGSSLESSILCRLKYGNSLFNVQCGISSNVTKRLVLVVLPIVESSTLFDRKVLLDSMDNLKKNALLMPFNVLYRFNPKLTLEVLFRIKLGYSLNLAHPTTYNEKLQWIKLYDRNPLMPICCDKFTVREYVESKGCGGILNNLIWQGFDPGEIPFDELPERFVVKVTHGSTFNIICENKNELDRADVIAKCRKWLKAQFLPCYGEWFYGIEKPRVIVEEYLEGDGDDPLFDYKFFCFNGEPKMVYVDTWRKGSHAINAYDMAFNLFEGVQLGYPNDDATNIAKPEALPEMIDIARTLSTDFHHVRVDLYCTNGRVYFGELTFTKGAGFGKISPYEFDVRMGEWLKLPCGVEGE